MHGITKTFRRKTELCIYISNHKGKHLVFLNAPSYKHKWVFLQARKNLSQKNLIFYLTQQNKRLFSPSPHSIWPSSLKSTKTYIHTPADQICVNNLQILLIVSSGNISTCWCCPFVPRSCLLECTSSVLRTHQDGKYWEILRSFVHFEPLTCLWFVSSVKLHWLGHMWGSLWWF